MAKTAVEVHRVVQKGVESAHTDKSGGKATVIGGMEAKGG